MWVSGFTIVYKSYLISLILQKNKNNFKQNIFPQSMTLKAEQAKAALF